MKSGKVIMSEAIFKDGNSTVQQNSLLNIEDNQPTSDINANLIAGMRAQGKNKLVSQTRLEHEVMAKQKLKRRRTEINNAVIENGMIYKGHNKLISENRAQKEDADRKQAFLEKRIQQRRPHSNKFQRIQVSDSTDSSMIRMTDFSYRTKDSTNGCFSTGLIRVLPNEDSPICSTFRRGLLCIKPNCDKRHDVPKHSTVPICSFFQRQGRCLRQESCPFRHIKVNRHTLICPQFQRLGYCEDHKCNLKHIN
jgi:hypothetical protein